jgi:hypothetical protein
MSIQKPWPLIRTRDVSQARRQKKRNSRFLLKRRFQAHAADHERKVRKTPMLRVKKSPPHKADSKLRRRGRMCWFGTMR